MNKITNGYAQLQTSQLSNDAKLNFYGDVITSFTGSEAEKQGLKNVNQEMVKLKDRRKYF